MSKTGQRGGRSRSCCSCTACPNGHHLGRRERAIDRESIALSLPGFECPLPEGMGPTDDVFGDEDMTSEVAGSFGAILERFWASLT